MMIIIIAYFQCSLIESHCKLKTIVREGKSRREECKPVAKERNAKVV